MPMFARKLGVPCGTWHTTIPRLNETGYKFRTTGASKISGEPPYYGPMTWPMATGSLYYDFPKAGRLSVDLGRTYFIEEFMHANDFSGKTLRIRWTKDL